MDLEILLKLEHESALSQGRNITDDTAGGILYMKENIGTMVPYFSMLLMACFLGTFGNLLLIAAILSIKELQSVGNIFICNLAFADLLVSSFVDIFNIVSVIQGESYFAQHPGMCEAVALICLIACFCSLYSIGAVSFNRYIHIVHNSYYDRIFTPRNTILMCISLWFFSFLLDSPNIWGWGRHGYDAKTLTCLWDRTHSYSYTLFVAFVGIATPVFIISISYILIYLHVRQSKKRVAAANLKNNADGQGAATKMRDNSMKLARTLFIIFAVFAGSWTPYAIIIVLDRYDTYPQEVHMFAILFAHINSSCNFFLYGATNKQFRVAYFQILGVYKCFPSLRDKPEGVTGNASTVTEASYVKTAA